MTVLLGAGGAVVVLAVLLSIRWAVRAVREWRGRRFVVSSERWDAALRALACASPEYAYYSPVPDPRLLNDEELCQAWCARSTFVRNARE